MEVRSLGSRPEHLSEVDRISAKHRYIAALKVNFYRKELNQRYKVD